MRRLRPSGDGGFERGTAGDGVDPLTRAQPGSRGTLTPSLSRGERGGWRGWLAGVVGGGGWRGFGYSFLRISRCSIPASWKTSPSGS